MRRMLSTWSRFLQKASNLTRKLSFVIQSPYNDNYRDIFNELNRPNSLPEFVMEDFRSKFKDRVALVDGSSGQTLTFNELLSSTYRFAAYLRDLGINRGDTVGIVSPNHMHYFSAFHGTALLGAISTTVNPFYTEEEMKYQFELTRPKVVVVHPSILEKVMLATKSWSDMQFILLEADNKSIHHTIENILSKKLSTKDEMMNLKSFTDGADLIKSCLTIPFSSGTTGKSKGVILTHNNLIQNCLQSEYTESDYLKDETNPGVILIPLPFYHIYGMLTCLCGAIRSGAKVIFMPHFELEKYLQLVQEHKVTRSLIVPPIVLALAKHPLVDKYNLTSLQCLLSGAAPLGAAVQEACATRLKCVVKQGWGMTELSPIGTTCRDDEVKFGSSGRLLPLMEAKILDTLTGQELLPTEEGELLVRGPNMMLGYFQNKEATDSAIRPDGFMHTGDIGRFDEDGHLFLVDRCKELIKYKGLQVAPAELESILLSMKEVADAIVIPVPDDEAGEVPRAYVVKRAVATELKEADVVAFVRAKVSPHKRLRGGVVFTDSIPKSPSGKLLRRVQIEIDRANRASTK